jgi:predicted phosphoribosyltransferase
VRFRNREEAGSLLAEHLRAVLRGAREVVVLAIPRGGVVVAAPVAESLGTPLDVIVPRKIGAPGEPELAVAALAVAGGEPILVEDPQAIAQLRVPARYLEAEALRQRREIERREAAYREGLEPAGLAGRTAVLVDDGLATGLTAQAAAEAVRRRQPREVVLAAPVAPPETVARLLALGLRVEVLDAPSCFMAVGQFYDDFHAVEDDEVLRTLRAARRSRQG